MTVGARIRLVREKRGLSQDALAKLMGYKDRSSISKIEKETDENIYMDTVQKFAEVLNCSPLYLMGWAKEENFDENDKVAAGAYQINQAVNKVMSQEDEQANRFINYYKQLNPEQKTIVDNLLAALVKKQ